MKWKDWYNRKFHPEAYERKQTRIRLRAGIREYMELFAKTQSELSYTGCTTNSEPRKLVLFVYDLFEGFWNKGRFPYTWPTIIRNDPEIVYGAVLIRPAKYYDLKDKRSNYDYEHLIGKLHCMDFIVEISSEYCKIDKIPALDYSTIERTLLKLGIIATTMAANIAKFGLQPDFENENVRFIHCKCGSCTFSRSVVIHWLSYTFFRHFDMYWIHLRMIKSIYRWISVPTLRILYIDWFGLCSNGTDKHIPFCQMLVDEYRDEILRCIKSLLESDSVNNVDIEKFCMYYDGRAY